MMKRLYFLTLTLAVVLFSCKKDSENFFPEANDDINTTAENTAINGTAQANDKPSEDGGNIWSLVSENGGAIGMVTMDESGNYTYAPKTNWNGTDEIKYQICDIDGDCVEATITITVEPVILSLDEFDNLKISALAVDGASKLWIATDNGLYNEVDNGYLRINLGSAVKVTTLSYENDNNTIWAGTNAGVFKVLLGSAEISGDSIPSTNLSDNHILSIFIDDNSARWFGTKTGFTLNTGDNWQKDKFKKNSDGSLAELFFSSEGINSIGEFEGDYFFATSGNKLWRTTNWDESVDAFTSATLWDNGYNGDAIADTMYVVFIDSRGFQWFGGQEGAQVHIGHNPKSENYSFKNELVNKNVHCIAEAPTGEIWCGTENGISIASVTASGVAWNASTASLSNNFVTSIVFQGNTAWVGTKMGLNKIDL